ncbi:MAG TPA: outer membrane beta-barrel protein, partial [Alphaproteobacteria bacterium]|nr:outer membrane beta-barrel protein [Alphaproteobacteria bacterium]
MKNFAFLAAAALAAMLLLPASAQAYPKQGWYTGLGVGLGIQEDSDATTGAGSAKLEFDPGFAASGSVGYGFESQIRPEFEISYRESSVSKATGTGAGGANGNFNAIAFMGNLFYDFDTHTGFTPYIGVGAGAALVGADNAGTIFGSGIDGQPLEFAYQGIIGGSFELSERLDATIDYRYFRTLEPDFKLKTGTSVNDGDYVNHSIMIGLRYIYGVPVELPPPVEMHEAPRAVVVMPAPMPAMMPPPPMPMAQPAPPPMAVPETYIVFFDFD